VAEPSQGALIVRLDEFGIAEPLLVRKSDGGFLYATTDLAGVRRRVQKIGADRVVYAVDARQSLHFRQVFAASKKAGYARRPDGSDAALEHAAFGTVLGDDGRPFKTRSGESVRLSDLLDEAVERAEKAVADRDPDLPASERRRIADGIGMAAIKYTDLSTDRVKDYVFNFDRMLAFEGDTGPYLLYALVRIKSIFRKAAERGIDVSRFEPATGATPIPFAISEPAEKTLALALLRYPAAVASVADTLKPHLLCAHLHDLAGAFAGFFQACPVLQADEPTRSARLRLCALTARVLEDGLNTLGIPTVERM
jgi:arginyl-tRNA synthetase